ncbi:MULTISPECIES: SMI1/KNR4 family protein [unclassified Paenibacillus]|uniref:SMI1/KNR4 family protein n=1 Tax=unclassified Paenibacillus TaxID=185978 RepID=UPI001AEA1B91|nr:MULTISPECIES: SMI1/KNR4 family protein [unclassified Paenibacillus]MBP1153793.1 hypothetical protein [Paenibacillus sp. PvP091]MBP1170822.1 hypothetical protein [Paenibacillus sp. PvR098]MBP2441850.1 hypothetical protein [Paenibacillus sp. PvP052]
MSVRYLFHLLTSIRNGTPAAAKDYHMPEKQFRDTLSFFEKQGYLEPNRRHPLSPISNGHILTSKGMKFLEEHKHLESEMPLEKGQIPHWVRFQGRTYIAPGKAVKVTAPVTGAHSYADWARSLTACYEACLAQGRQSQLMIGNRATNNQIRAVESKLGKRLPESLRSVISGFSKQVNFHWFLHESEKPLVLRTHAQTYRSDNENVPEFKERHIDSGGYLDGGLWDLDQLEALEHIREDLDYLDEEGGRTYWADSLLFCRHGNGSYFGIDHTSGEVLYLSMDGIMHGWRLGYDFAAFMHHWIHVGCAGHWGQDFMLFSSASAPFVDHTSDNALIVKQRLGLQHLKPQ